MAGRQTPLRSKPHPLGESDDFNTVFQEITKSESILGHVLGNKYAILSVVGEGGMATVYRAKEVGTGRLVAIKALRYADVDMETRFSLEIKIHSQLKHRNIVEPVDCLEIGGRSYFVMEFLDGIDLEQLLVTKKRLDDIRDIGVILSQMCDSIEYAHDEGVLHRDIKPENFVLVSQDDQTVVKVLDFGVAKLYEDLQRMTKTGIVLGSPAYMSPEQCMGMKLDPRSDIYSLGVVAYELITGHLPYRALSPVQMMDCHCSSETKPTPLKEHRPDLPGREELQSILDRALETNPKDRHQTVDDFRTELNLWWRVATAGQFLDSPFVTPDRSNKRKRVKVSRQKVINTIQTKSLHSMVAKYRRFEGQEPTLIEPSKAKQSSKRAKLDKKLNSLMGWIGFILLILFLSAVMAFGIITTLSNEPEEQAPVQQTSP